MSKLPIPPNKDPKAIVKWLMTLEDQEIEEGHKQYFDKWNWETGSEFDRLMCEAFAQEAVRRQAEIEHIHILLKVLGKNDPLLKKKLEPLDDIFKTAEDPLGIKIYYD